MTDAGPTTVKYDGLGASWRLVTEDSSCADKASYESYGRTRYYSYLAHELVTA